MEKIELNTINDQNIHLPKNIYVKYLKQLLEININKENYEECSKIFNILKLYNNYK